MGRVLMFTSLKGGVGKTTACAALAFALNFFSRSVLCVDLDFGVRGLDLALGAENGCGEDVLEVIRGGLDPRSASFSVKPSLNFLSAPALFNTRLQTGIGEGQIAAFLARCKEQFDFTLLDLPAGGGEWFLPLSRTPELSEAIVMTTADPIALRAAEQTGYEIRSSAGHETRLVVNRFSAARRRESGSLFELAQSAGIPVLGVVPEDGLARSADGCGIPLSRLPQSAAGRAYWNIASRLCGKQVPLFEGVLKSREKRRLSGF